MAGGETGGDSTEVVAIGAVAVGVIRAVEVADLVDVSPVLTTVSSPHPLSSRMATRITTTDAPRTLPMMMLRFLAVKDMFCLPDLRFHKAPSLIYFVSALELRVLLHHLIAISQ